MDRPKPDADGWTLLQLPDQKDGQQYLRGPLISGGDGELRAPCAHCGKLVGPVPFEIPAPNMMGENNSDTEVEEGFDVECAECGADWRCLVMSSAFGGIYIMCDGANHPTDVEVRVTHDNMADEVDDIEEE